MHRGNRFTILGRRVYAGIGAASPLRAALLLLLLPDSSCLFLLTFGLTVITLVQRSLRWAPLTSARALKHSTPLFAVPPRGN
jgi:hypothetical protein